MTKEQRTVILAASYNPPHNGHLALLEYLAKRYTKVIAVVGFNPDKKYSVSPHDRAKLLQAMIDAYTRGSDSNTQGFHIQVEVVEGYIWRYAKRIGATLFVRGLRSWDKDGTDERSLQFLNIWGPILFGPLVVPVHTLYIEGNPKYNHVSSTLIRDICRDSSNSISDGEKRATIENALSDMVPPCCVRRVVELYGPKE